MSSSNGHPFHIPPLKCANPPGEVLWTYAVQSSWQRSLAAPAPSVLPRSRTSPGLWLTCGRSQQCLMLPCCLACNELVVSVLFPRDGSQYRRRTKTAAGTAVGRLSKGNAPSPRLPAGTPAGLPSCHPSGPSDVIHSWYKLSATGLISQQLHSVSPRQEIQGKGSTGACAGLLMLLLLARSTKPAAPTFFCCTGHRGRRNLHSQKLFYLPTLSVWHPLRTLFSFPP